MTERIGRVICDITISADGYSAGLNQTEERPFGDDGGDGSGLRLHIVPLTLGAGTRLFEGVPPVKLEQVRSRAATSVTHVTYRVLS